jgi:beta-lactamase superfamily II metal-dependent hydrolase
MPTDFVSADETKLSWTSDDGNESGAIYLLWGDRVEVLESNGANTKVRARGVTGLVKSAHLGGKPLLELYFIDVGQGDGVLIRTPDQRNLLIDGGFPRAQQATGKNAADFVDWKFVKDDGRKTIQLDAMIASHNDQDHYGGLSDLLSEDLADTEELNAIDVTVEAFYHAGLSWWEAPSGRTLGPTGKQGGASYWTRLLGDRQAVGQATGGGASPQLAGEWREFFARVHATKRKDGQPTPIARLSQTVTHLPGFAPAPGKVAIRVLAPVEATVAGSPALKRFAGAESKQTNGHSVLLRLDYGRARILLTGDLNAAAQRALLDEYKGRLQELECDVAKACHHGSEDVSYRFLQAMRPAVTVISSGDNEGHDHPRPNIVAASATTGFLQLDGDELVSPLVYSTELARSVDLGRVTKLIVGSGAEAKDVKGDALGVAKIEAKAGSRKFSRRANRARVLTRVIYGLVNVRTDGDRILCATRNEGKPDWQIRAIQSRF